jgi:hypothetical protein
MRQVKEYVHKECSRRVGNFGIATFGEHAARQAAHLLEEARKTEQFGHY